jgi:Ca2+-binding RTX toxin-like protein
VLKFDRTNGLTQVGAFVDPQGSNFWGVEQFTTPDGDRLFAGSDRDFGLQVFRYTGPGAAQKPVCSNETVLVPFKDPADVPLSCSDANGNPLRQTRLSDPAGGTVADRTGGGWTYTHTGNRIGPVGSFTFKVNDGAADSNVATASLVAVPDNGGPCANRFVGSSARDVIKGSRFGDRISGSHGHDAISAGAGADCVSGNRGHDRLAGEAGVDRLTGHSGNDALFGGSGRDRLAAGPGNDRLSGGSGPDQLFAGGGKNRLSGGGGNDRIGARNNRVDRISCGAGRDRVTADANDRVSGDCERVGRG